MEFVKAFLVGGVFCAIGQVLVDRTNWTPARILTGYVVLGVILSGFGWYGKLVEFAGAGATLPLTGFGYTISEGMRKAIDERGALGILTGALTAASGGTCAALVFGFFAAAMTKSKRRE